MSKRRTRKSRVGVRTMEKSHRVTALKNLLRGVNKKNRHPEIDFGPPVGRELL